MLTWSRHFSGAPNSWALVRSWLTLERTGRANRCGDANCSRQSGGQVPKKGVPMDAEELKERLRLYERGHDELATSARSMSESYDPALLTLSSAFLAGSLAFIGEVVGPATATFHGLLYSALGALAR